jgi:hypothetical protein
MTTGKKIETYGSVKDGKLKISYRDTFSQMVKNFPDCRIKLTVEKLYNKRSTFTDNGKGQNGYYWGIVISEYCQGYHETTEDWITAEEAHETLKRECNFKEIIKEETGEILRVSKSTADLSTVDFEIYLEKCRRFIEEWFGITVPLPNEQGDLDFERSEKEFKLVINQN